MDTNPARGYAKINCRVIHNRFSSGRVLALYELCRNYVYPGKNTGETPWVEINNCLQIMGIDNTKCAGINNIREKCAEKTINEINEVSDIIVITKYDNEKEVTRVKFNIKMKGCNPNSESCNPPL